MAKRIVTKIGDVFCVEINNSYKRYFQYFCKDESQLNSSVIRVFKTIYPINYNPILKDIVMDKVDFYAHTILRVGLEWESWYKVGNVKDNFDDEKKIPIFGTCLDFKVINGEDVKVNPNINWTIWKINHNRINIGSLPEQIINKVYSGSVKPDIEIVDRMKFGYYRYTSWEYNTLKRIPYPYTNSYTKQNKEKVFQYIHFKGENVVQKIEIKKNGEVITETGNPLPLPKFWETNWKNSEFITAEEFNDVWNKYNKEELNG